MPLVSPDQLISLQSNREGIRNICILAHVDHGKTSLTDALLATNGIISPKLAGKIRYLDSRPDEQTRGITMESSAISLYFSLMRRSSLDAAADPRIEGAAPADGGPPHQDTQTSVAQSYLINLIDSPGHIDFSSEVSTASRLCDGAVVLVDAVEGVCSQTVTVLRQAWLEGRMKTLLVINKMDRLVTELRMTPAEAYAHLTRLLEQVNAVLGSFFQGERMEEDLNWRESMDELVRKANAKAAAEAQGEVDGGDQEVRGASSKPQLGSDTRATPSTQSPYGSDSGSPLPSTPTKFEEKDDEDLYFSPEKNNVIFSSAIDGWAFTVRQFAALYEKKLGIRKAVMQKVLWGEHYLDPKTKKVLAPKHLRGRALKPMFVQLVLDPIWAVYQATGSGEKNKSDSAMIEKITSSLNLTIPTHVLRSRDPRAIQNTIFASWLPLSTAVLVSVIESLPSPVAAQEQRLPSILDATPGATAIDPVIRSAMLAANPADDAPLVVYVSKMVSVKQSELPEHRRGRTGALSPEEARELGRKKREEIARMQAAEQRKDTDNNGNDAIRAVATPIDALDSAVEGANLNENGASPATNVPETEHLIGFARVFSGTLKVGDAVYVIPPKHDPSSFVEGQQSPRRVTITALYLLMGRGLEPLHRAPPGTVVGIGGLEGAVLKCGTLCSTVTGAPNLAGVTLASPPIVRVALEPENPADLERMVQGLQMLVQSDPCAQYERLESGEHVLLTAGELHLERCLTDLRDRFAGCSVQAGEPIVPYRETIVRAEEMRPPVSKERGRGRVTVTTSSGSVQVTLAVRPLPIEVTDFLIKHAVVMQKLYASSQAHAHADKNTTKSTDVLTQPEEELLSAADAMADTSTLISLSDFRARLKQIFEKSKAYRDTWAGLINNIVAFAPKRAGPNLLFDKTEDALCERYFPDAESRNDEDGSAATEAAHSQRRFLSDKITYAFQLAMAQGALCAEPVQGVAVILEGVKVLDEDEEATTNLHDNTGRLTGEVIKTVQGAIKQGFLDWSPRLLLAMYSCEIQASTEVLGRVYDVLTRRRGRVLSEALKEGTPFFTIQSLLPVATSFGFSDEIRKRTSGAASPQLIFAGFQILDEDPFWTPTTEEEMQDLGEKADKENVAKRWMDGVRTRKGLLVEGRKLVVDAEKQKTLKR